MSKELMWGYTFMIFAGITLSLYYRYALNMCKKQQGTGNKDLDIWFHEQLVHAAREKGAIIWFGETIPQIV